MAELANLHLIFQPPIKCGGIMLVSRASPASLVVYETSHLLRYLRGGRGGSATLIAFLLTLQWNLQKTNKPEVSPVPFEIQQCSTSWLPSAILSIYR